MNAKTYGFGGMLRYIAFLRSFLDTWWFEQKYSAMFGLEIVKMIGYGCWERTGKMPYRLSVSLRKLLPASSQP